MAEAAVLVCHWGANRATVGPPVFRFARKSELLGFIDFSFTFMIRFFGIVFTALIKKFKNSIKKQRKPQEFPMNWRSPAVG
jgi:hypothetical protein